MSKIALVGVITAHEGKGDELVAAYDGLFSHVATEPGTEVYILHRANDDPDRFFFYELFTDQAALEAHRNSDAMKAALRAGEALIKHGEPLYGAVVRESQRRA